MRQSTLLWSVLGLAVVIGLFVVKHRVQDLEDRLHALNAEIISAKSSEMNVSVPDANGEFVSTFSSHYCQYGLR